MATLLDVKALFLCQRSKTALDNLNKGRCCLLTILRNLCYTDIKLGTLEQLYPLRYPTEVTRSKVKGQTTLDIYSGNNENPLLVYTL